jgi:sugar phosphate isomerase/epimerase
VTNLTPPTATVGYCTNVHAGTDLASIRDNLDQYAVVAREACGLEELGVGLWLPAKAAAELAGDPASFSKFLRDRGLRPFTINGFPYDNFHQPIVKHRVYQPTWADEERFEYTCQLADLLAELLSVQGDESVGSISTLPLGWPTELASPGRLERAGENLRRLADHLAAVEAKRGRRIVVAIEPEPGCQIDTTDGVIEWFGKHLPDEKHRRYLTVCHDICHSAVMMEPQVDVLMRLARAGIEIGKVQVSNAIVADWQSMAAGRRREAVNQLREFAEDRYLHQTGRLLASGEFELAEDLPDLIADPSLGDLRLGDLPMGEDRRWVVHFHVPIFLERFGHLSTSQNEVLDCLHYLNSPECPAEFTGHFEIETYAWTVLPASMRRRGLAEDIASEVEWLRRALAWS